MLELIDYTEKYSDIIDIEESKYWGEWDKTSVKTTISNYDVFKIVLKDKEYAGHLYGNFVGDLFYFDVILIKEEFRNKNVGTFLLENIIIDLKNKNIKNIATSAEYNSQGNILLEPLLLKFGFRKIIDINGFWGSIYPDVYCEDCNSLPCNCKAGIFIKNI